MKRVVIVCVLFVVTLVLSIYCTWRVHYICMDVKQQVTEIYDAVELDDNDIIATEIDELHEYWGEQEYFLSPFIRHSLLDETSRAIVQMRGMSHDSGRVELCAQLEIIIWQMDHLWESEYPNWHNIL